jgi:hypothetical protein
MRNFLRSSFVATLAILLLAAAGVRSDAAPRTARAYDGVWSVVIYTEVGDCDRSLRYSVRIADGQVQAGEQSYQISGAVTSRGDIRVMVAEAGRSASGVGRLAGNNGRGQWQTSSGQCAGQWTAVRRSSNEF